MERLGRHESPSDDSTDTIDVAQQEQVQEKDDSQPLSRQQTPQDVPPNGGYGWVCVGCCFLINAHTWGLNSSYGVFLAYYLANNVFDGATTLDFAFVGGLSISMAMLVSPLATYITRRFGTRTCCFIGVFFETLSLIGASFAYKIWHLFLSQGVCFGWGMGFLFVASVNVPPQWFTTRRSLANGIGAAGSGFGGLVYSLAANAIIKHISLAWAFRVLGLLAFGVNITCTLLIRDRNRLIGVRQNAFDYKLFGRMEFTLLQAWGFFSMLGYVVLLFSLPNYADSIGLNAQRGSVIGAVLQLGQMLGRPPVGYFSDSFGRINMAVTMTFLCGLFSLVIWIFATSYGVLIFFAFIGGCVAGTFWATVAPVSAEVLGLKALPAALSMTWLVLVLPTTFSEGMALEIVRKSSTHYLGAQLFAGFMYIAAAICLWVVRTWRVGQLEEAALEKLPASDGSPEENFPRKSSLVKRIVAWRKV